MARRRMTVEILYFDGCPGHDTVLPRVRALIRELRLDAQIELKRVESAHAAEAERFLGSPTVRINGQDIDSTADARTDYGLKCRLYASDQGVSGDIPDGLLRAALSSYEA